MNNIIIKEIDEKYENELSQLITKIEAKKAKDFAKADELRDTIQNKYNVTVKDTREGITIL